MRQALHIFCKDVRRCWPYVALVLTVTAIAAILTPKWVPNNNAATDNINRTVETLALLLPGAWWLTIARLVHGENLVGDRQFWVTRPYSWKSLLAAKLLFCAVFLGVPFAVSDWVILRAANFSPVELIPGLLLSYCLLLLFLILPALVLACLTASTRQFLLACLVLVIGFGVAAVLQQVHPQNEIVDGLASATPGTKSWLQIWGAALLFLFLGAGLLIWQYGRRQTTAARAVVVLLWIGALVVSLWPSASIAATTPHPPSDRYPEVSVALAATRSRLGYGYRSGLRDKIQVDFPIELTGRTREFLESELASVVIQPEHGAAWKTAWDWYDHTATRGGVDWLEVHLAPRDFRRLNGQTVTVRASFGVIVYQRQSSVKLRGGEVWTSVPGFGSVMPVQEGGGLLWWRRPLREGPERFVCSIYGPDSRVLVQAQRDGSYPPGSNLFHFSPVVFYAVPFERPTDRRPDIVLPQDLQGEFVLDRPVALIRRDLEIPHIKLSDYMPASDTVSEFK